LFPFGPAAPGSIQSLLAISGLHYPRLAELPVLRLLVPIIAFKIYWCYYCQFWQFVKKIEKKFNYYHLKELTLLPEPGRWPFSEEGNLTVNANPPWEAETSTALKLKFVPYSER
jgi:hypothetical protein